MVYTVYTLDARCGTQQGFNAGNASVLWPEDKTVEG